MKPDIDLRQNYNRSAKQLLAQQSRYAHAQLQEALEQVERIVRSPQQVFVDMGYRGHDYSG